jgi:ATP-dependent DNA helicase DinG
MAGVEEIFSTGGALSEVLPGYVERASQLSMALDVEIAIEDGSHLIAEAGTGTGKTFAYLVPALLSGKRVIISTGTKTLQDQLFHRDIPLIKRIVSGIGPVVLLKGRGNYVCPERLFRNIDTENSSGSRLLKVREWYSRTRTGDLTELVDLERDPGLIPLVTSTADNCLANECPRISECPLYRVRERAVNADVVIINHHLLFADLTLQDDSLASILPDADVVITDEAHQLADVARQFFGMRVGSGALVDLCHDIKTASSQLGDDDPRLLNLTSLLASQVSRMSAVFREAESRSFSEMLATPPVREAVADVDLTLVNLVGVLSDVSVRSKVLKNCYQRGLRLLDLFACVTEQNDDVDYAHWIERRERGFVIHLTPLSVAREFGDRVRTSEKTWIFTSATLTVGDRFDFIMRELGLAEITSCRYESPFDYRSQVKGWVPRIVSRPGTDEHTNELVDCCLPVFKVLRGRAFFLVTSYRALELVATRLSREPGIAFVAQGSLSKAALLDKFRSTDRCILVATHSFWEGVDVRGSDLRCLVIDKLPFASPADPLVSAFMGSLERSGSNGFMDFMVPDAAITLRQGFGRLIREETDRGIFILGDPRTNSMPYGGLFLASLPDIEWMTGQPDVMNFTSELASETAGN